MSGLVEFLKARIEEDQVKRATMREWHAADCGTVLDSEGYTYPCDCGVPERMALECEAKRELIRLCESEGRYRSEQYRMEGDARDAILRLLAAPYSDHPDFDASWGVSGG